MLLGALALAISACSGSRQASPVPLAAQAGAGSRVVKDSAGAGMCSVYSGFGALSFCYNFDEASGTTLVDSSGAGNNGTISSSGVAYQVPGLTSNSSYAETTNGSSGSMSSGFVPASGSFSLSFFVDLRSNANNWARLAATGNPAHTSPSNGLNISVNSTSTGNQIYVVMGYGSGSVSFGNIPLALNTPSNLTLSYNSSSNVATVCLGSGSSPACSSTTLAAAYVASGNPLVFGGGSIYYPANATFDEAGYWQGTVLTSSQMSTIAGYTGTGASPSPSPTPSPTSSAAGGGMCSIYSGSGALSFCYNFDEASGTTLLDSSGAGNNGTISSSGVTYHAAGLTSNSSYAESTNGSSGSMSSGFVPTSGSFSLSFFVDLLSNASNWGRLAATGNPAHTSPENGWNIGINSASTGNEIFAVMGYGSGNVSFGEIPLGLNTSANVTLTYNATTGVATFCVGSGSSPACESTTLPSAYVASGNPIVFGGGSKYVPANATFDEAAYWQGTVLSSSEISTIAGYSATGAPTPTPTPSPVTSSTPTPGPTPTLNNWATYGYDNNRDGYNPNTAGITPASIGGLHVAWQLANDGAQTQPIVATNIGAHQALIIVGADYSMYAYDGFTGKTVWSTQLAKQDQNECGEGGDAGTAAYVSSLGAVFVAAGNGASPNHVILYELNVATGSIISKLDITPTLLTGEGVYGHTAVTYANGLLYLGTSSNCEDASWRGRVVAVSPSPMAIQDTFFTTYGVGGNNYGGGGVWAWGGVSADSSGNVYAASGNAETPNTINSGTESAPFVSTTDEQAGYAEHLVKLTSNLQTVEGSDYPGFNFTVGFADLDYTGTPVLFQPAGCDLMTGTQGKGGTLVINDTTNLSTPTSYQLSEPNGLADYIGNPGYSPNTGLLYAAVASGQEGSLEPPGMVAFQFSACSSSILWASQFGPDSFSYESDGARPRSAPTVTAGGVVFMGTPCTVSGSTCGAATSANPTGALWAIDASTGAVLGGGNPVLMTPDHIRMAPSADGLWVWVFDNSGNLYALTVDPTVKAVALRPGHRITPHMRYPRL